MSTRTFKFIPVVQMFTWKNYYDGMKVKITLFMKYDLIRYLCIVCQ